MNIFQGKGNVSLTQKICLSGILIALVAILQKIIAINYLPGFPYFRISFGGPALIIFASIFLGPFWGGLVGFSSDLFGYFVFDASGTVYLPQISVIYFVLGFASYYIFDIISKIKNHKILLIIETISFAILLLGITAYIVFISEIDLLFKILIPIGLLLLFCGLEIFTIKYKSETEILYPTKTISFSSFITDFVILVLFGSLMKTWAFLIYYDDPFSLWKLVIVAQTLVMFFNVMFNTAILSLFLRASKKYIIK